MNDNNVKNLIDNRLSNLRVSSQLQQILLQGAPAPQIQVVQPQPDRVSCDFQPDMQEQLFRPATDINMLTDNLIDIQDNAEPSSGKKKRRKAFPIFLAACLCLVMAFSVLAAAVPSINVAVSEFFSNIVDPKAEEYIEPVQAYCVSNGIEIEIVGAMTDGDSIFLLLTLKDIEQDRLSDFMMLPWPTVNGVTYSCTGLLDYNVHTKTANVGLICFDGIGSFPDKNIDILLDELVIQKLYSNSTININLNDTPRQPNYIEVQADEISTVYFGEFGGTESVRMLEPSDTVIAYSDVEGVDISNIGYLDGQLHVQLRIASPAEASLPTTATVILSPDSLQQYYWEDLYTNPELKLSHAFSILRQEQSFSVEYIDYVFNIAPEELPEYTLLITNIIEYPSIQGEWTMSFELEAVTSKRIETNMEIDGNRIYSVTVSPYTVHIDASYGSDFPFIRVIMKDGAIYYSAAGSMGSGDPEAGRTALWYAWEQDGIFDNETDSRRRIQIIDINQIETIEVNGIDIGYQS